MERTNTPWQHGVVLVCTNERPEGAAKPSCGLEAGTRLRSWLKQATRAESGPVSACRVLSASCLDVCPKSGVAVSVQPGEDIWIVDPKTDQDELLAAVKARMETIATPGDGPPKRRKLGLLSRKR